MKKRLHIIILFMLSICNIFGQESLTSHFKFSDSLFHQLSFNISQFKGISDFDVQIIFAVDDKIFPASMLTPEMNGKVIPIDTTGYARAKEIIINALNKYPAEVIKRNLTKVYVIKKLELFGQKYGGTYHNSIIYLTRGNSDFWFEQAFHHEFSSILLNNYMFLFNKKKWISYNQNIEYELGGFEGIRQGKNSKSFSLDLNKRGVLSEYGTASIEEDFNLFAENLFLSSPKFKEIVSAQKRIKGKLNMVMQFYNEIDSITLFPYQVNRLKMTQVEAKIFIDSLYIILTKGGNFKKMAKRHSDDPATAKYGGKYTDIKKGQMIPEFENVFLNLKLNEISKPFKTPYGYHIVQLLKKEDESYIVRHILIKFME